MSPVNHVPAHARQQAPGAQTQRNARLTASPVVRTRVLDRLRHHLACGTRGEMSGLIVADLRRDWPALDECAVDLIIGRELAARTVEAETYRGAMQSAIGAGRQAAEDVRAEGVSDSRDGWGKPVLTERRRVVQMPGAVA